MLCLPESRYTRSGFVARGQAATNRGGLAMPCRSMSSKSSNAPFHRRALRWAPLALCLLATTPSPVIGDSGETPDPIVFDNVADDGIGLDYARVR